MAENYSGEKSGYNEADRKMERLHKSQQVINTCRLNLLYFDKDSGLYHYEMIASELLSLLYEIRGKMSKDEREKFNDYRLELTLFFDTKEIFNQFSLESFSSSKMAKRLNVANWIELRKLLFEIEDFTRDTLDLRGFSAFNIDDDEGDTY